MFKSLLVPLDGSAFSERSLPLATGIARASSAALHLLQVQQPPVPGHLLSSRQFQYQGLDLDAYAARHREEALAHLEDLAGRIGAEGVTVHATVVEGRVVDAIAEHAEAVGADAIVMTTHGRSGANRMWLGSVADGLVRHTTVPILLVHPDEDDDTRVDAEAIQRVMVALDGSDLAESVLEPAAALVDATGGRLILGHVLTTGLLLGGDLLPLLPDDAVRVREEAEAYLEDVAERLRADGRSVEIKLMESGSAGAAIPAMAQDARADLVALATHGHGGLRRMMLGSVADKVLRSSPLPLLVLRPGTE
jgi:nucleotide-binding universal stress UspA family protein